MTAGVVDRVLACRTLPSLPGVALEVVELTREPSTPVDRIATLVQNDPALTAKILRTVNSSFYGLTDPCPTISRAVSLLGVNTVKSLVLGFSLVEMAGDAGEAGFDLTAYWRRTIYSAAGARLLARKTGRWDPEEAFIGALLQDVGMLAAHAALGDEYIQVIGDAPEDHDGLAAAEVAALGFDHPSVGYQLMRNWKVPPQVAECTRRHHEPDQAAPAFAPLVQLVALGMDAAAIMTVPEPAAKLARLTDRASAWFSISAAEIEGILQDIADGASQLGSLLHTPTGQSPDVPALLAEANEQLTLHQIRVEREAESLQKSNTELARQATTDALTGAANRNCFDAQVAVCFEESRRGGRPLAVLFTDADNFKSVNDAHGHQAGDAVLVELSSRLRQAIGRRGTVCRYGGEEFAVILPGADVKQAEAIAEELRRAIGDRPIQVDRLKLPAIELSITISIGVAATDQAGLHSAAQLVHAADEAVYVAKREGRDCIRVATGPGEPAKARRAPRQGGLAEGASHKTTVLVVEDDPLAAKLIELLFARRPEVCVRAVASAEEALAALEAPGEAPTVMLCDLDLPGMPGIDLIRKLRQMPRWAELPILAITGSTDGAESAATLGAGASAFVTKAQLCSDFGKWVAEVLGMSARKRKAA